MKPSRPECRNHREKRRASVFCAHHNYRKSAKQFTMKSSCIVLLLVALCSLVAAQTFQYSRGWTNGKRGAAPGVSSADPWANKLAGCQLRLVVSGRDSHQLYFPCEMFRHMLPEDAVVERYRRKSPLDVATSPRAEGSDANSDGEDAMI